MGFCSVTYEITHIFFLFLIPYNQEKRFYLARNYHEISLCTPLVVQRLKHLPAMWETWARSLGREDPLEKKMATHSSILAWRIPWMEELDGLQSTGRKESDTTERIHFHFYHEIGIASKCFTMIICLKKVSLHISFLLH